MLDYVNWSCPILISSFDRGQNRLRSLVGEDLFSTIQPLSPQTQGCNPIVTLSLFPRKMFSGAPLFSSISSDIYILGMGGGEDCTSSRLNLFDLKISIRNLCIYLGSNSDQTWETHLGEVDSFSRPSFSKFTIICHKATRARTSCEGWTYSTSELVCESSLLIITPKL